MKHNKCPIFDLESLPFPSTG